LSISDSETLVKVTNVSKKFCRDFKKSLWYGLKEMGNDIFHPFHDDNEPNLSPSEFWANKDISFEVKRGECLGLIGRNGAGKTTLLKMLNGIIKPDRGSIEIKGKVGALIALGAGFNPILTGRENIYVNGAILGLTKKEIKDKIHEVVKFAEISEAIDAPVRTYSSGMKVRLGFAIASILLLPDILIIDEVLAVGDTNFKVKCYNRIKHILPRTAVIFVSHNMFDINRICQNTLVLDRGLSAFRGNTTDAILEYNLLNQCEEKNSYTIHRADTIGEVNILKCVNECEEIETKAYTVFDIYSNCDEGEVRVRALIYDDTELAIAEWDSIAHKIKYFLKKGKNRFELNIENIRLKSGIYRLAVVVTDLNNHGYFINIEDGLQITVKNSFKIGAPYKI
jgi:lipopolysaccharide transport system ATP-binding protein